MPCPSRKSKYPRQLRNCVITLMIKRMKQKIARPDNPNFQASIEAVNVPNMPIKAINPTISSRLFPLIQELYILDSSFFIYLFHSLCSFNSFNSDIIILSHKMVVSIVNNNMSDILLFQFTFCVICNFTTNILAYYLCKELTYDVA